MSIYHKTELLLMVGEMWSGAFLSTHFSRGLGELSLYGARGEALW